jgi:hypothetical protein
MPDPARRRGWLPANWPVVVAIMATSTIVGMTISFSVPLLSLVLENRGADPELIGINAAASGVAVFAVAPWLPRLVGRLGVVDRARARGGTGPAARRVAHGRTPEGRLTARRPLLCS